MRAVAVTSVVLFHFGLTYASQGFLGVDVFFVISGFLITRNLISKDSPDLIDFYLRRVRRIVPVLVVTVLACLAVSWFVLLPSDYASSGQSAAYAAVGAANIFFAQHTGYFDRAAELQPLLNLWSLGVEEQFYLIWPALIWLLLRLRSQVKHYATLGIGIAALTLVDFLFAAHEQIHHPTQAFYYPQYRAWELTFGAALNFARPIRLQFNADIVVGVGLSLILGSVTWRVSAWIGALPACVGAGLVLWPRTEAARFDSILTSRPARGLGLISYSLYLIHWPVLVFFRQVTGQDFPDFFQGILLIASCCILASLSWRFVENPLRVAPAWCIIPVLAGICLTGACGLVVDKARGFPGRVPKDVGRMSDLDTMWSWPCPNPTVLIGPEMKSCRFGASWAAAQMRGLLIGDSHAQHLEPMFDLISRDRHWAFEDYVDCPAAFGGHVNRVWSDFGGGDYQAHCSQLRSQAVKLLQDNKEINLVVFASIWTKLIQGTLPHDGTIAEGTANDTLLLTGLQDFMEQTARPGRRFLIMADLPLFSTDPVKCAVAEASGLIRTSCVSKDQVTAEEFWADQRSWSERIRALAHSRSDLDVFEPGEALCRAETCISHLDGEFLYRDSDHLRRNLRPSTYLDLAAITGLTSKLAKISVELNDNR